VKRILILVAFLVVLGGGAFLAWTRKATSQTLSASATIATLSATPEPTATPTVTPTATLTATASTTLSPTPTNTLTPTSTLAVLVLRVTVVNADVTLASAPMVSLGAAETPTPLPTVNIPLPPTSAEIALASTANAAAPGWVRYEDDDPAIQYTGQWSVYTQTFRASGRHYKYAQDAAATATLRFLGAGVRVRYVASYRSGVFEIRLDGRLVRTVDSYYPKARDPLGAFLTTEVWGLYNGWHTLEIVTTDRKNFDSTGTVNALDAIEVYRAGRLPTDLPSALPTASPTPTASPAPALKIQLIAAPPPLQQTATALPPAVASVNFTIAYDLNGNKAIDPTEGVQGLSVRLITSDTNQVVASGYTNTEGFVHLEAVTNAPLRLVLPYLNKYWDIPARSSNLGIKVIIPPANQPGIIP
jgi:hypothetical protein